MAVAGPIFSTVLATDERTFMRFGSARITERSRAFTDSED